MKMNLKGMMKVSAGACCLIASLQACGGDEPAETSSGTGGASADGGGMPFGGATSTGGGTSTGGTSAGGTTSTGGAAQASPCELAGADVQPLPYEIAEDFPYVNEIPETAAAVRLVSSMCDEGSGAGGAGGAGGGGGASGESSSCYVFDYVPDDDDDELTPFVWGGIIVQSNEMADGLGDTGAGICIEPGATTIRFEAKADNELTDVKFGSIRPGPGSTEHWVRLSSTWTEYTISIPPGETYNESTDSGGVWNGFSAVLEWNNQDGDPLPDVTRVWMRDVVWER